MKNIKLIYTLAFASVLMTFAANTQAQTKLQSKIEDRVTTAVKKIENACGEDLKKFCSTVTPGEGRVLLCLEAHEDKISSKCDGALYTASRNLDRALDRVAMTADACWQDIDKLCSNVPEGEGRVAQCLVDKRASVSAGCKTNLNKLFQAPK
jgi:hypothetical protein